MDSPITPAPTTATSQSGMHSHQCVYHLTQPEVLPSKDNEGPRGDNRDQACAKRPCFSLFSGLCAGTGLAVTVEQGAFHGNQSGSIGALAVFGVVAAGGGGYLANRHSEAATQPAAMYPAATTGAVTETENSIFTAPAAPARAPGRGAVSATAPASAARVARPGASHGTSRIARARRRRDPAARLRPTYSPSDTSADSPGVGSDRAAGNHDPRTRGRRPEPPRKCSTSS